MEVTGDLDKNNFVPVIEMRAWGEWVYKGMGGEEVETVTMDNFLKKFCLKRNTNDLVAGG